MLFDRVKQTSFTTGTGTYSLNGAAPDGYQGFVAAVGTGNRCFYVADGGAQGWEIGVGTVTDAATDTLSRDEILASSNAGAAVNWTAGTRTLFVSPTAARGMNIAAVRHNLDAAAENPDPAIDDTTLGYGPGSLWVYKARNKVFVCVDATDGAAEWVMLPMLKNNTVALVQSFSTPDAAMPPYCAVLGGEQSGQPFGSTPAANSHSTIIGGGGHAVTGRYCSALGKDAKTSYDGMHVEGAGAMVHAASDIWSQGLRVPLAAKTSDATPTKMSVLDGDYATNSGIFLDDGAFAGKIFVVARQVGSTNMKTWEIDLAMRDSATLVGSTVTDKYNSGAPAWSVAVAASGDLSVEVTGAAATNIVWAAYLVGAHMIVY